MRKNAGSTLTMIGRSRALRLGLSPELGPERVQTPPCDDCEKAEGVYKRDYALAHQLIVSPYVLHNCRRHIAFLHVNFASQHDRAVGPFNEPLDARGMC